MDMASVRQAIVDEFLRQRGATSALGDDLLNRAICQALVDLRPTYPWFALADLTVDTVAAQRAYTRNDYAGSTASKLPWGFLRPLGERLFLDHEKTGTPLCRITEIDRAAYERIAAYTRTDHQPTRWTIGDQDLLVIPGPDSVDEISGQCWLDLGTPVPKYAGGAWSYRLLEPDGTPVRTLASALVEDNSAGTYVDITDDLNSAAALPVAQILPAPGAVEDALYVGADWFPLTPLTFNIATSVAGLTIAWEYYNGAWTALSSVVDGTSAFSSTGSNTVAYTQPTDAEKLSVNSGSLLYWVRARITAGTIGSGFQPFATQAQIAAGVDPATFSTRWFTEPSGFDVLVARAALQYFLRFDRDNEQSNRAQSALAGAMLSLRKTQATQLTLGEIEPWMGGSVSRPYTGYAKDA